MAFMRFLQACFLVTSGKPFADQCRFAKAGGGRDEGELAAQTHIQSIKQTRAEDNVWRGDIEIRG
jgi:hypothetical protein